MDTPSATTHWYILGAGAIGCLWAAYWRQMGAEVTLITHTPRDTDRLTLTYKGGETHYRVNTLTAEQLIDSNHCIDYLLVTTKAQHTVDALLHVQPQLGSQATIAILQNGMASVEAKQRFSEYNIYTAITTDGAYRRAPMDVVHAGRGNTFVDCDPHTAGLLPSGLSIQACDDIDRRQWQKLAINCAINGLTAVYRCKNGQLLENPEAMQGLRALCEEISAIAIAAGQAAAINELEARVIETLTTTADNYSSMYQDIAHHRETEIDYLNGYLVAVAQQQGISCENNLKLIEQVKALPSFSRD